MIVITLRVFLSHFKMPFVRICMQRLELFKNSGGEKNPKARHGLEKRGYPAKK
jgi:hypothetical protein